MLSSFPKVFAIGHKAVADLFKGPVLVEEKVDGSQFSFGVINGQLFMRSKGAEILPEAPEKMFSLAVSTVSGLKPFLRDGWTYRAEFLQKPKHNVMKYDRVPNQNIILFDVNTGDEVYLTREDKEEEAARIGLEIVPVLYQGLVDSPETLYQLIARDSVLGGGKIEGIVVKNYNQFGMDKKVLMGKFVTEEFKETHSKEWKADNPTLGDVVERIIATLRSEVRWDKSIARLKESGKLEGSPRDIGILIREIQDDIKAEELDFISQKLTEFALPRIVRASTAGFPEYYKKTLLESAFEPTETL
jgi:RNA ligase-like protein